jgi:cytochrome c biogenesis protein CcmG/thiol:disulfide interchange protein DsbE
MSDVELPAAPELDPAATTGDVADAAPRRRRTAPFVVLAVAVVFVALFVVLVGSKSGRTEVVESFLLDKPAPRATGTTLEGKPFDLSRRKGSWVVLNFFDPTCIPCQQEHPELIKLAQQQRSIEDGAELYTIINQASGESVDAVKRFFADNGGDWPVVADPTGGISVSFGVAQVPETWIIDPNGIVRERFAGTIRADQVGAILQRLRETP